MSEANLDASFIINFVKVVIREAINHKTIVAVSFAIVSLAVLLVGTQFPKQFSARTQIYADSQNIIRPLLQGQAATTSISDQIKNVREAITSPRLLRQAVEDLNLVANPENALEVENTTRSIGNRRKRSDSSLTENNRSVLYFIKGFTCE